MTSSPAYPPTNIGRPTVSAEDAQKIRGIVTLAWFYFNKQSDYDASIKEAQSGLRIDPNNGQLLGVVSQAQKAWATERKAGIQ